MNIATTTNIITCIQSEIYLEHLFTAYDITKSLRHDGYFVEHKQVQGVIKSFDFSSADYHRTLNSDLSAFVYHPRWIDAMTYDNNRVPEFNIAKATAGMSSNASSDLLDKRGRFTLSCKHVRDADLHPYTKVKFVANNGHIVITKAISSDIVSATVDKHSNIRLTRRLFENAFNRVPSNNELTITVVQGNGDPHIMITI